MRMMKFVAVMLATVMGAGIAVAQTTKPSGATTRGSLADLDEGFQQLYRDVDSSVVRVVVPIQVQAARAQTSPSNPSEAVRVFVPQTLSATQPFELSKRADVPGKMEISPTVHVTFAEFAGVVLDREGNVLLPLFVDKQLVGENALRVTYGNSKVTKGKLLGSDRQTSISVLKLDEPVGEPMKMASENPAMGSLVLMVSPVRRQVRVALWTGGHDEHSMVMNSSGALAGFNRYGHMFEPYAFGPVVQQILATGTVKRSVLGVLIRELGPEDWARTEYPKTLGSRPAARVETIAPDSTAEKAGVQKGDLILSLGGDAVNDLAHFAAAISKRTGPTELKILREGKEVVLNVDLQPR
jgi:S1-C subfamily serine protease